MTTEEQLKVAQDNEKAAEGVLLEARTIRHNLALQLASEMYDVRIGSIVRDEQGKEYYVTRVHPCLWAKNKKPRLEGNPRKKSGAFGEQHRNIYGDWEVVKG